MIASQLVGWLLHRTGERIGGQGRERAACAARQSNNEARFIPFTSCSSSRVKAVEFTVRAPDVDAGQQK